MFSSDQKIENLSDLFGAIKNYLVTEKEYLKLTLVEVLAKLSIALIIMLILALLMVNVIFFLSLALCNAITPALGTIPALLVTAAAVLLFGFFIIAMRKPLIEKPVVILITRIILPNQ